MRSLKKYMLFTVIFMLIPGKCFSMCGCCKYLWLKCFGRKCVKSVIKSGYFKKSKWGKSIHLSKKYARCKAISSCGNYVGTGCFSGEVTIFNIKKNSERCLFKCDKPIVCLSFSKDDNYVLVGLQEGIVMFDIRKDKKIHVYKHGYWPDIFLSNDIFVLLSGSKTVVLLVNTKNGSVKRLYKNINYSAIFFNKENGLIVAALYKNGLVKTKIVVFDIKNGEEKYTYKFEDFITCTAISDDSNHVLVGFKGHVESGELIMIDLKNKKKKFLCKCSSIIKCASFSKDGNYMVFGSENGEVSVFNLKKNEVI
ncbi:hypothetical protein ACFLYU_03630, partial [Candidatus Dependentiae bacterium]